MVPAEMSLTTAAPDSIAFSATTLEVVSIEMTALGKFFKMAKIAGITRSISSLGDTGSEPGLELAPPMSIKVAPSSSMRFVCVRTFSISVNFPPS